MYYYIINVLGRHGYSFMVKTDDIDDIDDVICECANRGLFENDVDADYAIADDIVTPRDIEFFKNCTYEI